jgi:hypothetical protein
MRRLLTGAVALLLALAAGESAARADFHIVPGSFQGAMLDADGQPEQRAGVHPDRLRASFAFSTQPNGDVDGNVKDLDVDLPAGFIGNAQALPTCPRARFDQLSCPPESQVGVMEATFLGLGPMRLPIYNIAPEQGGLAEFGFIAVIIPVRMVVRLRADGDYGTRVEMHNIMQAVPMTSGTMELWGIPADHLPDDVTTPRTALLTTPTSCDPVPPTTTMRVRSWATDAPWLQAETPTSGALVGCEQLPFDPSAALALDAPAADTPSGLTLDLTIPQHDDPDGLATSHVRQIAITMPDGVTLSPGVAGGLSACDDAQLRVGSMDAPVCPASSKIGTVELTTPLVPDPLAGEVYLGRQLPTDAFRLFIVANGPGFAIKLTGSLQPDPQTGRLTVLLTRLPQLAYSRLRLHLKDGPRAPLATPPGCGTATGSAAVTPYRGGAATTLSLPVAIVGGPGGAACAATLPFAPSLLAGSSPAVAGAPSAFSMAVRRADGEQTLDRLTLTLPPGLTARIAAAAQWSAGQAAAASCPAGSRIGTVSVEAGAGPSPLALAGDAFLTGPQGGAPFGLSLVLHAIVGPLDLGTVVMPATLRIDPLDAHLTVATRRLPQLVAGVPLRLRTLALEIDRPGLMVNPTSCQPAAVSASIASSETAATATAPFAVGGCLALPFRPAVSLRLGPPAELRRGGHPGLSVAIRSRKGEARLRSASVRLPRMLTLDQTAVSALCSRRQALRSRCPANAAVGTARVRTTMVPQPLSGTVYVVQPADNGQPDLWAALEGMGVQLNVRSTTSLRRDRPMTTTFVDLPDVPLASFKLKLRAGAGGPLTATAGSCRRGQARRLIARAALHAHSGKRTVARIPVRAHPRCRR